MRFLGIMVGDKHGLAQTTMLDFTDKLVGRGLTADHIIKRLQALNAQLDTADQDDVDRNDLANPRAQLIHRSILLHKDQGVRAYAACCLAELLRLYAPDAPYTPPELRDIFQFFVRQLKDGLKHPDSAYHNQYFQLLESLSTVKSAVLVCDLPQGEDLMLEFFTAFFYIVRRGTVNKKMEAFMADILVALLDECATVTQTVLDTVLAQFMDKDTVCARLICDTGCSLLGSASNNQRTDSPSLSATASQINSNGQSANTSPTSSSTLLTAPPHVPPLLPMEKNQRNPPLPSSKLYKTRIYSSNGCMQHVLPFSTA